MSEKLGPLMTSSENFEMAIADEGDADLVRNLLIEAAEWMAANGIKQWNAAQFTHEEINGYFRDREIYLMFQHAEPVGLFTLQTSDPDYWGSLNEQGYSYLHRLTVRPSFRGRKLARELIYYAAGRSRLLGRKGLRFDCWSENRKLNPYYEQLGMKRKGIGTKGERQYVLYEMDMNLYERL